MTDLALCGSRDSRSDFLLDRNASWHRSPCERTDLLVVSMSWSRREARRLSEASDAAVNARGAHVLKDKMPRPPSLTGREIRALSTARDGAGDAVARICARNWPGTCPDVPRGVPSRLIAGNAVDGADSAVGIVAGPIGSAGAASRRVWEAGFPLR
jgi:hypothetical protein